MEGVRGLNLQSNNGSHLEMQGSHFHFPCSETVGPLRLFESHRGVAEGAKQVLPPVKAKGAACTAALNEQS